MGILGSILRAIFGAANDVAEHYQSDFDSGYDCGAEKASKMSDEELRSSLKRAQENGISGWNNAGKARAVADEYKNRKSSK